MGHLNIFVFAFALVIAVTQALHCWECDNAVSGKDCRDRGRLVECKSNQEMCSTETRLINDDSKLITAITRGCKQALACENNQVQNPRAAWFPSQCNNRQGSVCRCCCDYDECNAYEKSSCSIGIEEEIEEEIETELGIQNDYPMPPPCNIVEQLENGFVLCDGDDMRINVTCIYACLPGYTLSGADTSTCVSTFENGPTEHQVPECVPLIDSSPLGDQPAIQCPMPNVLRRVVRKCTKGNDYSSQCQFQCERKLYTANPGDVMDNHCQLNGTWSSPPPCCRLPCPPNTIMDLYIILDSSSSVKRKNWNKAVQFVAGIISKLTLNKELSQVSVIRYNEHVDEEQQLFLRENQNETQIRNALATIPYDGVGTKTGRALQYLRDNLLKRPTNRLNVTDVVLLLTDGRASDDVKTISQQLRDDGVEMFAIGLGKARKEQLLEITGSSEKYWAKMNNYDALTADAATRIGQTICEKSCL